MKFNNRLKGSYIIINWDLFQGYKIGSTPINQSIRYIALTKRKSVKKKKNRKSKNHMIISIDDQKSISQNSTSIYGKNSQQSACKGHEPLHN